LLAVSWAAEADAAPKFGDPLDDLPPDLEERFYGGLAQFSQVEDASTGLGPVFNRRSCVGCHSDTAPGGAGSASVRRFGTVTNGKFDALDALGGSLMQSRGINDDEPGVDVCKGESIPPQATIVAKRVTTPLFGLGLVDAVPDNTFLVIALFQKFLWPGTAGRPNLVQSVESGQLRVGKYGWKAQGPSVAEFAAEAYLNEMGITSPMFPDENCPGGDCEQLDICDNVPDPEDDGQDTQAIADFMTYLAPPPRAPRSTKVAQGKVLFHNIGCHHCHMPALITGSNELEALDHVVFWPYSDFLLHDMGSLGDGISQGLASGTEMRTAPLWGLRARQKLLHDGRTQDVAEAILAHDGQGQAARDQFAALNPSQKTRLLVFLSSL
jgi:CxxC motif-containing protein (DUF1111 family)